MWIYNGEMLINLSNGVNLHIRQQDLKYSEYEATVVLSVPVAVEGDNNNWIFQGTATECKGYIDILAGNLVAFDVPANGAKTEPESQPEREPRHVPADYINIPF